MAGHPKRSRLIKELERRAETILGTGASALDYLCAYLADGGRFAALARDLAAAMGESISRPLVSNTAHWFDVGAKAQLKEARTRFRESRVARNPTTPRSD
jgi:hypothetical protein